MSTYRKKNVNKSLRYFNYCLVDRSDNSKTKNLRYHLELLNFLKNFIDHDDANFKRSFTDRNKNNIFLLKTESPNVFYFVRTNDTEMIHRINTERFEIQDIESKLEEEEKIGFSSYISFHDGFFGFISSLSAPGVGEFTTFINELLFKKNIKLELIITPILNEITLQEAKKLKFVGTSSVEVSSDNKFFHELGNMLGRSFNNTLNVEAIEIKFKAKRGESIKKEYLSLLEATLREKDRDEPAAGFIDGKIQAKNDMQDRLIDYYINSRGNLVDHIKITTSEAIGTTIEKKINDNQTLQDKVKDYLEELRNDEEEHEKNSEIRKYNELLQLNNWDNTSNNSSLLST